LTVRPRGPTAMTTPTKPEADPVEPDERFPSGPWTGFFLQPSLPGRHKMELILTFRSGMVRGEGRDRVGSFFIVGRYDVGNGKCHWSKRYQGKHDVAYQGYNEGRGIWGNWEIPPTWRGGFHIWPEAMGDPTLERKAAEVEAPADPVVAPAEPILEPAVPAGAGAEAGDLEPVG